MNQNQSSHELIQQSLRAGVVTLALPDFQKIDQLHTLVLQGIEGRQQGGGNPRSSPKRARHLSGPLEEL